MHLKSANIPSFEPKAAELPDAPFLHYKPNFEQLKRIWSEFGSFQNLLVIGHGGSVTSFSGMYQALGTHKNVYILSTVDPDYISELKNKLNKHDTLVLAISKSGETVTQIEALMHFLDYPLLFITGKNSTLDQIGKKNKARLIVHPPIGGRYTAFTEVALVPAMLCGLDVHKMFESAQHFYSQYREDNIAMKAAQIFYALEQNGFVDVFMPFYSHQMFGLSQLIIQLCHESFGKAGQGQTYFAAEAPESQHHTNQRFFGGRKNVAGFFIEVEHFKKDSYTEVPTSMHSIPIRDGSLFQLNKIPLSFAMHAEFQGTWENAKINNIPAVSLNLDAVNPEEVGAFIAFWQVFAVYSAVLRGVDPFDQPQVENSKHISWNKRRELKGYV